MELCSRRNPVARRSQRRRQKLLPTASKGAKWGAAAAAAMAGFESKALLCLAFQCSLSLRPSFSSLAGPENTPYASSQSAVLSCGAHPSATRDFKWPKSANHEFVSRELRAIRLATDGCPRPAEVNCFLEEMRANPQKESKQASQAKHIWDQKRREEAARFPAEALHVFVALGPARGSLGTHPAVVEIAVAAAPLMQAAL